METAELIATTANRRGLSLRTIKTYRYAVERFFRFINKEPKSFSC